jgi:hypothetical protein
MHFIKLTHLREVTYLFILVVLGLELKTFHLLGKQSTTT